MTKNLTIGFIVAIILIFVIGIRNTRALENNIQFNYSEFVELLDKSDTVYRDSITSLVNYLTKYENDYYVFVYFNTSLDSTGNLRTLSTLGFKLIPKNDYIQTNVGLKFESNNYVSIGNSNNNTYGDNAVVSQTSGSFSSSYGFFFDYDFDTYIAGLDAKIESANFSNKSLNNFMPIGFDVNSENIADFSQGLGVYIYSNFDFNFVSTDYNLIFDDTTVSNGDTLISYYDYLSSIATNPTADINVSYFTNDKNLATAEITVNFDNYSTIYKYEYSFNGKDYIKIENSEVKDNKFIINTYRDGVFYFRIKNMYDEIIFYDSKLIDVEMDTEDFNYYEIDINDFYDSTTGKWKYRNFFFENKTNPTILPYIDISLSGDNTNPLPLYITYNERISDVQSYLRDLEFEELSCTPIPFEYTNNNLYSLNYTTYTVFSIVPCVNTDDDVLSNYSSEKLIIRTNLDLNLNDFVVIDGVMYPSSVDVEDDANFIYTSIMSLLNPILEKLPFINQLYEIYEVISYDYGENELPPNFEVDLSFLGVDKTVPVIDFRYFLEYRDYIFFFEKLFLGFYTVVGVIKSGQKALEG